MMFPVPSWWSDLRYRDWQRRDQDLGSEGAEQRGQLPRTHWTHLRHGILRERWDFSRENRLGTGGLALRFRILFGHCCWRLLREVVGFAEAEELQDAPPGRGIRGAGPQLRLERLLPRRGGVRRQGLLVQTVGRAQGINNSWSFLNTVDAWPRDEAQ